MSELHIMIPNLYVCPPIYRSYDIRVVGAPNSSNGLYAWGFLANSTNPLNTYVHKYVPSWKCGVLEYSVKPSFGCQVKRFKNHSLRVQMYLECYGLNAKFRSSNLHILLLIIIFGHMHEGRN